MNSRDLPPQNLEAERWVLGAILIDPSTMHDVAEILEPDDFYRDAHQILYKTIRDLYDCGKAYDTVGLADELTRLGKFKEIGGDNLLLEITTSVAHTANTVYHAEIIHQKAITRRLIQTSNEIVRECYSGMNTAAELVEIAEQRIFAIGDRDSEGSVVSASEVVASTVQSIMARQQGVRRGVITGFNDLDYLLDGLKPQELCYVAARPSQGKTALALAIVERVAVRQGEHVLFTSLEMSRESLAERLLSSIANINGDRIRRPWLMDQDEKERLAMAVEALGQSPIDFDDRSGLTLSKIGAAARRVKSRHGLKLLVIDYLGLIESKTSRNETEQETVAKLSRRLKGLARELNVPILCVHQLNRGPESREDHRPRMSDLRSSGQLEQDADVVLLLHRPDSYNPDDQPGIAELIIAKNRNGPTGSIELAFVKECTRFDTLVENVPAGQSY